jgi:hypothetical protein
MGRSSFRSPCVSGGARLARIPVIASEAKQSSSLPKGWIASSRSLSSDGA